jgi:hypothetical protein
MAWKLSGNMRETCSCNMHCPCWIGIKELMLMDQGYCGTTNLFRITSGNSDGVDLSGLTFVWSGLFPGPTLFDGNATSRLYVQESASADQVRELETIFQGKRGGPMAILAPLSAKWLSTQKVKIEVQDEDDLVSATAGRFGKIKSKRLRTEAGKPMTIQNLGFTVALEFDNQAAEMAPADGTEWSDPELPRQWVSKSGTIGSFTWNGS